MKKLFLILSLVVTIAVLAFANTRRKPDVDKIMLDCNAITSLQDPYKVVYSLRNITKTKYKFSIHMILLDSNAYFGSPQSSDRISGAFSLDFGDTTNISLIGELVEFPVAQLKSNKFGPRMIHEVHENTTYTQAFELKTQTNFNTIGRVRFVIEPKCTLEELHFGLKMESGKLTVIEDIEC
ncbi:MAG: hypothetical protein R3279_03015 [Putridiphycobacter sp.]|nr:hypothetical protein [Putridiphycobacter sp.]